MAISQDELTGIVSAVLTALKTNSKSIMQLTPSDTIGENDWLEISEGRRVSYSTIKRAVLDAINNEELENTVLLLIGIRKFDQIVDKEDDLDAIQPVEGHTVFVTERGQFYQRQGGHWYTYYQDPRTNRPITSLLYQLGNTLYQVSYKASAFKSELNKYGLTLEEVKTEIKDVLNSLNLANGSGDDSIVLNDKADNKASGMYSTAEGSQTTASGDMSHAEGIMSKAVGNSSHAEGWGAKAAGDHSHAEGFFTKTSNQGEHAEGMYNVSNPDTLSSVGNGSDEDKRHNALEVKKDGTILIADVDAEGAPEEKPMLNLQQALKGKSEIPDLPVAKGSGMNSVVLNLPDINEASGNMSLAEGSATKASGDRSHAEGMQSEARGMVSHAEGISAIAEGTGSHAEGMNTEANGGYSHAEGYEAIANGDHAHAEGRSTEAKGSDSHAEGQYSTAQGANSHAEGHSTLAKGSNSHAEGDSTVANNYAEHAEGKYNVSNSDTLSSVGNGTSAKRHNAWEVKNDGTILIADVGAEGEVYEKPMLNLQQALKEKASQEAVDELNGKEIALEEGAFKIGDADRIQIVAQDPLQVQCAMMEAGHQRTAILAVGIKEDFGFQELTAKEVEEILSGN